MMRPVLIMATVRTLEVLFPVELPTLVMIDSYAILGFLLDLRGQTIDLIQIGEIIDNGVIYLGNSNSHICNASTLGFITGNNAFELFKFIIPYLLDQLRKIILGNLLHGRVPRTVSSHHQTLGMPLLAGRPASDFLQEKNVKWILQGMNW